MTHWSVTSAIAASGLFLAAFAAPISAASIVPVSAVASSQYPTYGAGFAIDQGGISAVTDWASNSQGVGSFLNLDLGALYSITSGNIVDRVTSGGPNGAFFGGTTDFTTSFSLSFFANNTFSAPLVTYNFAKPTPVSPSSPANFAYSATLTGSPATQFIRYTVLGTNGPNPGLSNISFQGVAVVPEAATWLLLILGFGAVCFAMRRRPLNQTLRVRYI